MIEPDDAPANQPESTPEASAPETESADTPPVVPDMRSTLPEPLMIELVSQPPPDNLDGTVAEQGTA